MYIYCAMPIYHMHYSIKLKLVSYIGTKFRGFEQKQICQSFFGLGPWMVSPNLQILLSLKIRFFLSFQEIIKINVDIGSTEFKLWQQKESSNY